VVALLDDTLIRKRGHRIAGTSWRRDPWGPHFVDNFIWASRFLQISLALPEHPAAPASSARAIPVDLLHAPSSRKPSRRADAQQWQDWRALSAAATISRRGAERLTHLRQAIDEFGGATRPLLVCSDTTFTNRTVLRDLPPRTTLIGRIRKDARLYALPTSEEENHGRGRHRCYGQRRPTPEQWRRDESIPWTTVQAFAAGNVHDIKRGLDEGTIEWAGMSDFLFHPIGAEVAFMLCNDADLHFASADSSLLSELGHKISSSGIKVYDSGRLI
jgi:hypothetical protein